MKPYCVVVLAVVTAMGCNCEGRVRVVSAPDGGVPADAGVDGGPGDGGTQSGDGGCAQLLVGAPVRLTNAPGLSSYPSIAATATGFALLWDDDRANPGSLFYNARQVFFNSYDDAGSPLGVERALTALDAGDCSRPVLVRTPQGFASVYQATDGIRFVAMDLLGQVSGASLVADGGYENPSLTPGGDAGFGVTFWNTVVSLQDGGPNNDGREVFFVSVDAQGQALGPIVEETFGDGSSFPRVAWDGTAFGLVWQDRRDGSFTVYFRRVATDGSTVTPDVRVTPGSVDPKKGITVAPQLVWTGSEYGIAYADTRSGTYQVYLARLDQTGALLGEVQVSHAVTAADTPGLAVVSGSYVVTWVEKTLSPSLGCNVGDGGFGPRPISVVIDFGIDVGLPYNGASPEAGACEFGGEPGDTSDVMVAVVNPTLGPSNAVRVTQDPGFTAFPVIGEGAYGPWVAWFDSRDGNGREIYAAPITCR